MSSLPKYVILDYKLLASITSKAPDNVKELISLYIDLVDNYSYLREQYLQQQAELNIALAENTLLKKEL